MTKKISLRQGIFFVKKLQVLFLFIKVSDRLFSVSELSTTESWCQEGWAKSFDLSFDKVDDTVERIHVKDVSLEDFIELYEKPYKPVS